MKADGERSAVTLTICGRLRGNSIWCYFTGLAVTIPGAAGLLVLSRIGTVGATHTASEPRDEVA
jgi:hypothetical protein